MRHSDFHAVWRRALSACVLGLLICVFCAQSRAQVLISAPTAGQARALQAWYGQHIPARFCARGRLAIRELPDSQMDAYLRSNCGQDAHAAPDKSESAGDSDDVSDIDGVYEGDPDRISLRLYADGQPDRYTFAHEYGHYVWFRILTASERRRYVGIYDRQKAAHSLVTQYAATDVEEGFAEAFSFYAAGRRILAARDPASLKFLAGLCRSGDRRADE
jgi:hypothetical protein